MAQRIELASLPDYVAHMQLYPLIKALREKKKIVVIAGAGMSAAAGIPTFDAMPVRSRTTFSMSMYNNDTDTKRLNKTMCDMYHRVQAASPTQFHHLLKAIAEEGRLHRLYTQNVDGLDTQLAPLKTSIPLPLKEPWPRTIQLHGDLMTVRCQRNPKHLSRFDPAFFPSPEAKEEPFLTLCAECDSQERSIPALRPRISTPVLRPRIWLYDDHDYPDADAISKVQIADLRKKPDVVLVVGTALKVESAKKLAKDMCTAIHQSDGIAVWINLKAPTRDLDCFDFVIEGNCETVAMHVSTWWLNVPLVLNDSQIQDLQQRCRPLFIARSPAAAINRALAELDTDSLSRIFQQPENKSKILDVKENGELIFASAQRPRIASSSSSSAKLELAASNKPLPVPRGPPPKSPDVLPKLLDCWKIEMSKRLSEVVVEVIDCTTRVRKSSTVVTEINLNYRAKPEKSLWRLKPGEYLDDEIINAYFELLQKSVVSPSHIIANTFLMQMPHHRPYRWFTELVDTGTYTIYLPVNWENYHWSFAVITSKSKQDPVQFTYYDSIGGEVPRALLDWIRRFFPAKTMQELKASPNPKQNNGTDCGLFVLIGIRLLITGRPHLTQSESNDLLPSLRERVLAELLASSLDPSEGQYRELIRKETVADETGDSDDGDSRDSDSDNIFVSPSPDSGGSGGDERRSPGQIASKFAREATMLCTLKEAIAIERASKRQNQNLTTDHLELAQLWLMITTEKRALKQRYIHYEFSRQFWAVMKDFNRSPHERGRVPKATISKVMDKLEIPDRAGWKYVLKRARRASVWTELIDIFKGDLEHPSVVLCAVPNATYRLEALTLPNREVFFETIRSRLKEPGNEILPRLKAASALYWAVIHSCLPAGDLPIESANDDLPFEQKVSCGE